VNRKVDGLKDRQTGGWMDKEVDRRIVSFLVSSLDI